MKMTSFCQHHIQRLVEDEQEAKRYWESAMARAEQAYFEGRMKSAEVYFRCAIDVVRVRGICDRNRVFDELFLLNPLSTLLDVLIYQERQDEGKQLLETLTKDLIRATLLPHPDTTLKLQEGKARLEAVWPIPIDAAQNTIPRGCQTVVH